MKTFSIGYVTNSSTDVTVLYSKVPLSVKEFDKKKNIIKRKLQEYKYSFLSTVLQYVSLSQYKDKTIEELADFVVDKLMEILRELIVGLSVSIPERLEYYVKSIEPYKYISYANAVDDLEATLESGINFIFSDWNGTRVLRILRDVFNLQNENDIDLTRVHLG